MDGPLFMMHGVVAIGKPREQEYAKSINLKQDWCGPSTGELESPDDQ